MSAYGATLCRVTSPAARYWSVVGQFVDNETKRRGWTDLNFAFNARLSRATIARLKAGEALGEGSLAKIEGALELPRDLLTYIAEGDLDEITAAIGDRDPDLPRWIRKKITESDRAQEAKTASVQKLPLSRIERDALRGLDAVVADERPAAARRGRKAADNPEPHAE